MLIELERGLPERLEIAGILSINNFKVANVASSNATNFIDTSFTENP